MPASHRTGERIAKLLARAGIASRREVERMIAEGRIAVNGAAIDTPNTVLLSLHGVTVDGNPVAEPAPARLFLYHKPPGLLVTERDPKGRPTIYDRLPADLPRVVPVGRLDLNTEGLLLLTTDGALKRQLELPATGVERAYRARAYGQISQDQLEALIEGVEIEGVRYGPIDANLERRTGANVWIELILTEGKNREVRRVLEFLGLQISRLIRTRYGPFVLGELQPGEVGEVRAADLARFRLSLRGLGKADQPIAVTAGPKPARDEKREGRARPKPAVGKPGVGKPAAARPDGIARERPRRARDALSGAKPGAPVRGRAAAAVATGQAKPLPDRPSMRSITRAEHPDQPPRTGRRVPKPRPAQDEPARPARSPGNRGSGRDAGPRAAGDKPGAARPRRPGPGLGPSDRPRPSRGRR